MSKKTSYFEMYNISSNRIRRRHRTNFSSTMHTKRWMWYSFGIYAVSLPLASFHITGSVYLHYIHPLFTHFCCAGWIVSCGIYTLVCCVYIYIKNNSIESLIKPAFYGFSCHILFVSYHTSIIRTVIRRILIFCTSIMTRLAFLFVVDSPFFYNITWSE